MKVLLLLAACVACAVAAHVTECGPLQILKVKQQWAQAFEYNAEVTEQYGLDMWQALFDYLPKARELFTRVRGDNLYSPEFRAHMVRVLGGLNMCISLLGDEPTLQAALRHLHEQHKEREIPEEYLDAFGEAVLRALPKRLGGSYDRDAWVACFSHIGQGIRGVVAEAEPEAE